MMLFFRLILLLALSTEVTAGKKGSQPPPKKIQLTDAQKAQKDLKSVMKCIPGLVRSKIYDKLKLQEGIQREAYIKEVGKHVKELKEDMEFVDETYKAYQRARIVMETDKSLISKPVDCGDSSEELRQLFRTNLLDQKYIGKGGDGSLPHGPPIEVRAEWFRAQYQLTETEVRKLCESCVVSRENDVICAPSSALVTQGVLGFHYKTKHNSHAANNGRAVNCHAKIVDKLSNEPQDEL